jgi:hypothetical protein
VQQILKCYSTTQYWTLYSHLASMQTLQNLLRAAAMFVAKAVRHLCVQ